MKIPQFKLEEFTRLLQRVVDGDDFLHCNSHTRTVITEILKSDYPEKQDDIEFFMDMINREMRKRHYTGQKRRFPATKLLDQLCCEPLYISNVCKQ